jgi:hypothetical protein
MKAVSIITVITALTILLAAVTTSPAAAIELDVGMRSRPEADAGPTKVTIELYVIDIAKIDDRDQTFKADLSIRLQWHDPRLARRGENDVISLPLSDIWNPRLRILNQRDVKMHFPEIARIDAEGTVAYEQRYSGDFTTMADIHRFPFDERTIRITMGTVDLSPSDISLAFTDATIGRAEILSVPNWTIGDVTPKTGVFRIFDGREFLKFDIELIGSRKSTYYIWSVIIPLILIVMMSWSVFFVKPKHLSSQLTMAATSMLTLIAYRFAISSVLPPVPYLTRMDVFITGSTVFVFLALAESVTTGTLADNEHNIFAEKLDSIARIVFPSVFAVFVVITFLF